MDERALNTWRRTGLQARYHLCQTQLLNYLKGIPVRSRLTERRTIVSKFFFQPSRSAFCRLAGIVKKPMDYASGRNALAFAPSAALLRHSCLHTGFLRLHSRHVPDVLRGLSYAALGGKRRPRTMWRLKANAKASSGNGSGSENGNVGDGTKAMPDEKALRTIVDQTVTAESKLPADADGTVGVYLKAEDLGGRKRRISGSVDVPVDVNRVWRVITSYDRMQSFMPNIVSSVVHKRPTGLFLEQVGVISRKLMLRTRVLLQVEEDLSNRTVWFTRVEGRDFTYFVGKYVLEPLDKDSVRLRYQVTAVPFPLYPMSMVEGKVLREVPKMLAAIRDEAVLARYVTSPV